MSDVSHLLWLIPALPLAAAFLTAFLGPKVLRAQSHWPCILGAAGACVVSAIVFWAVYTAPADKPVWVTSYYTVFHAGAVNVDFRLRADALTALMLVMVTFISTLIAIYSIGYMHGELDGGHGHGGDDHGHGPATPNYGYPRFFAEVALFIFSMTMLVLGDNLFILYAGWEGVGLCSYLLIGFWFTKPSAADAARKAFLVTRIGDVGLFLGILLLWVGSGFHLDYQGVFANFPHDPFYVTLACLLLLCGAAGKSAQFPLYVWLPDAMEGPTPVSALIHAATMVTAGVYLIARCTPLFVQAPAAQLVVACIGCFTALFAALIALTQNDLKRVLAYSTLSQLGYMFLGLGCAIGLGGFGPAGQPQAGPEATAAVSASMFHLLTHAFFKALLFLAAGSVMHAMGNVIDMRRFSGLRKLMPWTHWTFLMGALALSGLPPFSGFWSKDEIVGAAFDAGHHSASFGAVYYALFIAAMVTAFLTAFYTFRAYFLTFWGEERVPEEAGGHAHESPLVMTVPLVVLAVFAAGVGAVLAWPPFSLFGKFLLRTPGLVEAPEAAPAYLLMGVSSVVAAAGIGLAYWMYVARPGMAAQAAHAMPRAYLLSSHKFFVDEIYDYFLVQPVVGLTKFLRTIDQYVVDGLVDIVGNVPKLLGSLFWPIQNGLVQYYALLMVLGLTVFLLALVRYL